jgi:hypothetical protein
MLCEAGDSFSDTDWFVDTVGFEELFDNDLG